MGNLSSCTTGFMLSSYTSQQLLPHTVRVFLVDGSVLKLKAPIPVSKLLAEYPNHVICSLASLKPGLHALSSLLPDEKLQLGGLYLLLPSKSEAQKAQKSERVMRKRALNERSLQDIKVGRRLPTKKSEVGVSSRAGISRNGDVGSGFSSSASEICRKCEVGPGKNELQAGHGSCRSPAKAALRRRRQGERHEKERQYIMGNKISRRGIDSLHSRRSRSSWTPRLQPINERQ